MALGGLIASLIGPIGEYGQGVRQRTEGAGTYNLSTGKFNDPKKVERMSAIGAMTNPISAMQDKNLTSAEKLRFAGSWFTGMAGLNLGLAKNRRERMEAENAAMAQKYKDIEQRIQDLPDYEIAPEAEQKLALLEATGDKMTGLAEEATEVAQSRAGREMPGSAIIREDIAQNTAQQLESAQMSENAMALIPLIGNQQQSQYRQLAKENIAYRDQANKDVQRALMSEAQTGAQAAGLEAEGLSGMISEKGKAYQSELDKALTGIDFNITRQAQEQLGWQAAQDARAAQTAGMTSALSNIASSYFASKGSSGFGSGSTSTTTTPSSTPRYGADAPVTEGTPLNVKEGYGGYY